MTEHEYAHDPTECDPPCTRCSDFQDGWNAGKLKATSELIRWQPGAHSEDCRCTVCTCAASIVAVLGRERTGEPALGQPGVQAPPEAAGATGVGFASRPGGVS